MVNKKTSNEQNIKQNSVLSNILFCLNHTLKCYPILILWCLLAAGTNVSIAVLTTFIPKIVIEDISDGVGLKHLLIVTFAFTVCIAILTGFKTFWTKFIYHQKYQMNSYYMRIIAKKGLTTDYCNQEKEEFRRLQSESFQAYYGNYSPLTQIYDVGVTILSNVLGIVLFIGILMRVQVVIVAILVGTSLVSYFLNKLVAKWLVAHNNEKTHILINLNYIARVTGEYAYAKDIRLYNMSVWLEKLYIRNLAGYMQWMKRYTKKVFQTATLDSCLMLIGDGVTYAYLIFFVAQGRISAADFVLYLGVVTGFSLWMRELLVQFNILNRICLSVNYVRAYLHYPEPYRHVGGMPTRILMDAPREINLCDVAFRYEGAEYNTLEHINMTICEGEHLAIVGLNGAGKTTLAKLICGLLDPTSGRVTYGGVDVKEYERHAFYHLFSTVFQQHSLMPVTIEELVAESLPEKIDREQVIKSLKKAGIWEKIEALPLKTKSVYSKLLEDAGAEFSGGEIQKLLLARALYKNAPVIILDEPTAALDPLAESRLYGMYNELMDKRTAIFISHRLASTRFCDRILLIENGRIIEEGTHESLLLQKGKYFEMYEIQARYYREQPQKGENASCIRRVL